MAICDDDHVMTPAEVAAVFGVHAKTVTKWARDGKLAFVLTLGGHRRYKRSGVEALLRQRGAS
jgi:excisionase family DNA binding protein